MILKINRDEITDLVRYCAAQLHSSQHELRTPYISIYENMEWNRTQMMDAEECSRIQAELDSLGLPIMTDIHSRERLEVIAPKQEPEAEMEVHSKPESHSELHPNTAKDVVCSWEGIDRRKRLLERSQKEICLCMHQEFLFVRFHPSGTCTENVTKETCFILEQPDLTVFYMKKLRKLWKRRASAFVCPVEISSGLSSSRAKAISMKVMLEQVKANDVALTLQGWYRAARSQAEDRMLLVTWRNPDGKTWDFLTQCQERADLTDKSNGSGKNYAMGFTVCLDRELVGHRTGELQFSFVNLDTMERESIYTYPYCIAFRHPANKTESESDAG